MINLPARCGLKTKRLVVELAEQFERRRGADRERRQADQDNASVSGPIMPVLPSHSAVHSTSAPSHARAAVRPFVKR
jgi:hypothetical protein